jgi:O-acetyl-ADP-ribose deacetylase (regulator of RNase III)
MSEFRAVSGDITRTEQVDAIVTLINSGGAWFGGVDGAIQRIAGGQYHARAAVELNRGGLRNGMVVIAKESERHSGSFKDVIFVVDDLESPLNELVLTALTAAEDAGYSKVAMPLMRTGVMLGVVERTVEVVVQRMRQGIRNFWLKYPDSKLEIVIVVFGDKEAVRLLNA